MMLLAILLALSPLPHVEGWTPPPPGPLIYADSLWFTAPRFNAEDRGGQPWPLTDLRGVIVQRCAFQNDWARYQGWAPWMLAWHDAQTIYCVPGQRVLFIGSKRFHFRVVAVDSSGNRSAPSNEVALP